jgi:rsbT co-antagonist protein RsbR
MSTSSRIPDLLLKFRNDLLGSWVKTQVSAPTFRPDLTSEGELRTQSEEFLDALITSSRGADLENPEGDGWETLRTMLGDLSRSRALKGFSPTETATFVFSFKQPLFELLARELSTDARALASEVWLATSLLDRLGLLTTESYQRTRDDIIKRQQSELLELSTPVIKLWEGVLAVPLVGTMDSARAESVTSSLLQAIADTGSPVAILDITGVPTVDTSVAQHLIKTVTAIRLMGGDCIISGIRPQIAQTMVQMDVTLTDVITKARLADAIMLALKQSGFEIRRAKGSAGESR